MPPRRHGSKGDARKSQIVQATLDLVVAYGVAGCSMSRIAVAAGVTKASLYEYFPTRRDLLLAALDVVFDRVLEVHGVSSHPDALERLREIGRRHTDLILSDPGPDNQYMYALVEFMAAAPEEELRHEVGKRQMAAAGNLARIADEGKAQGTIAPNVDSLQVGWMVAGWAWTETLSHLVGAGEFWNAKRSGRMLDLLLDGISTRPALEPEVHHRPSS